MRVWHKSLIPVLPREQLIAQRRECSAIAGTILKNGTPNHILVKVDFNYLFAGWHENKYFKQCYYNLEEKYDCGGILKEDFEKIYDLFYEL